MFSKLEIIFCVFLQKIISLTPLSRLSGLRKLFILYCAPYPAYKAGLAGALSVISPRGTQPFKIRKPSNRRKDEEGKAGLRSYRIIVCPSAGVDRLPSPSNRPCRFLDLFLPTCLLLRIVRKGGSTWRRGRFRDR